MTNWNSTIITINHTSVEYIYVPFQDALFREKSIQTHRQFNRLSLGKATKSLAFILCTVSSAGRASALQAEGRRFEPYTVHHRDLAQLGRASGLGPEGHRFESCNPDHYGQICLDGDDT